MSKELKYFFTFGQNHTHPKTGDNLKDCWVEIVAHEDISKLAEIDIAYCNKQAREAMFKRYGLKWSMQYDEKEFNASYFPKGCYEKLYIPLPEDVTLFTGPFAVGDIVMIKSPYPAHHGWTKERMVVRVDDTMISEAGHQFVYTIDDQGKEEGTYASLLDKIKI